MSQEFQQIYDLFNWRSLEIVAGVFSDAVVFDIVPLLNGFAVQVDPNGAIIAKLWAGSLPGNLG